MPFISGETPSTLYLEVLGIAGQKDRIWENFTIDVAKGWMEIETNGKKPVPHWAKQWSYIVDDEVDIYSYIREVSKGKKARGTMQKSTEISKYLQQKQVAHYIVFRDSCPPHFQGDQGSKNI